MKKLILCTILTCAFAVAGYAQKVEIEQTTADKCAKCFIESAAKDEVIDSQKREIKAKDAEIIAIGAEKAAAYQIISLQKEQIEIYRKITCSTTSFLFGLIKKKSCL